MKEKEDNAKFRESFKSKTPTKKGDTEMLDFRNQFGSCTRADWLDFPEKCSALAKFDEFNGKATTYLMLSILLGAVLTFIITVIVCCVGCRAKKTWLKLYFPFMVVLLADVFSIWGNGYMVMTNASSFLGVYPWDIEAKKREL